MKKKPEYTEVVEKILVSLGEVGIDSNQNQVKAVVTHWLMNGGQDVPFLTDQIREVGERVLREFGVIKGMNAKKMDS